MGILQSTITGQKLDADMTFGNFLSASMLWDETMAMGASSWSLENPDGLFVGIVGNSHVKFSCGVPARCARMLGAGQAGAGGAAGVDQVRTIMINSQAADTGSGTGNADTFMLGLQYAALERDPKRRRADISEAVAMSQAKTGSPVLPLADLLWYSPGAVEKVGIFANTLASL